MRCRPAGSLGDHRRRRRFRSAKLAHSARRRPEDISRVREAFVNSAKRAVQIGFEAIELHYGPRLSRCIRSCRRSPTSAPTNTAARWRIACASVSRSRRRCARRCRKTIALGARITGSDWRDGGLTADDAVTYAKALKAVASTTSTFRPAASMPTRATRPSLAITCRSPSGSSAKRDWHARRWADHDAGSGRGDRCRRQGRHGGARRAACSTIRAGAGTQRSCSVPRCPGCRSISAPRRSCGRPPRARA